MDETLDLRVSLHIGRYKVGGAVPGNNTLCHFKAKPCLNIIYYHFHAHRTQLARGCSANSLRCTRHNHNPATQFFVWLIHLERVSKGVEGGYIL